MARVPITYPISISDLNSATGFGNSLGNYRRTSTATKSNTTALVPANGVVSMSRLRGAYASGTYRNINILASSSTTGINVFPRSSQNPYLLGLSNNSDPLNAYTLQTGSATGNFGYPTTCNYYSQWYYTTPSATPSNGMYFRISDVSPPYAGGFEEEGAWVVAIGLNFQVVDVSYYYLNAYIFDFSGGGNFTYGTWSPTLTEVFDGNNFFAVFVSGGTYYYGMLNRAQLRAGVIQPVYALAFSGPDSGWWYNSISTACARWEVTAQTAGNTYLLLGWDEYLVRGYDIPNGARLYGYGDTATRNQVTNSGSQQTVDGRIFE